MAKKSLLTIALVTLVSVAACDDDSAGGGGDTDMDGGTNPGDCPNGVYDGDVELSTPDDFADLEGYTDVGGLFQVSCEECSVIEHLECLEMIYDATIIVYNDQMVDLSGLENLRETNESINITTNSSIQDLQGLNGLEYIGGPLFISFNESLSSLDGLDSLTSINGFVQITDNPNLGYCQVCDLVEQVGAEYATTVAFNNKLDQCWDTEYGELWCY